MWTTETNSASSLRHRMPRATVTHRILKAKPPQNAVAPNSTVRRQIIIWENFVRRSYEGPKIKSIKSNKFDQSKFFSFLHTLPGGRTQPRAVPITVSCHIFCPPPDKRFPFNDGNSSFCVLTHKARSGDLRTDILAKYARAV